MEAVGADVGAGGDGSFGLPQPVTAVRQASRIAVAVLTQISRVSAAARARGLLI
jgi:hypothetical protein